MKNGRIERIEWARLIAERPRVAGGNARLGVHGKETPVELVRIAVDGETAFGWSRISRTEAEGFLGLKVDEVIDGNGLVYPQYRRLEFPLMDWRGRAAGKPVYALVGDGAQSEPYSVRCYDTTLLIDDLDIADDAEAVRLIQDEARDGLVRGHRAFKIKVGRGAMHMPLRDGTRRDIAVVEGVREVVGSDPLLMLDANNGYNLNLTKEVLAATEDVGIYWMEEAFHEDPALYGELQRWLDERNMPTLISDGEGDAASSLISQAQRGLIDVIQYDIRMYGFNNWLELGANLDRDGIRSAPHNYGGLYGNYAACHLAAGIDNFLLVEWDEAQAPGVDTSRYAIVDGRVQVPSDPGFGLELDDRYFTQCVKNEGWSVAL